jgi:ATP synthase protein I
MANDPAARMSTQRPPRARGWDPLEDVVGGEVFKPLTAEEASALRAREPSVSPWRVLAVMVAVGVVSALLAGGLTQRQEMAWSVLYGAAAVVVPGALMARGMTSKLSSMSPGSSAVSFMLWEMVKIAVSVLMLALAPRVVPNLSFPAMLVGVVLCMKVYWVALLWRGRTENKSQDERR